MLLYSVTTHKNARKTLSAAILHRLLLLVVTICSLSVVLPASINPEKVQVVTVLDPFSPVIYRDVFTLVRSLRKHGGTLNAATITVCIPALEGDKEIDQSFERLALLDVEVCFIPQIASPSPKTLNKFAAWATFDSKRFDHLLWVDADIYVAADPLPVLEEIIRARELSLQALHLSCAPELYNWMVRYPTLNESRELFWNPVLTPFRLLGDGEIAPHGVCNTGVIFMDKMIGQPLVMLPYDLNYMAHFEVEIIEEAPATPVLIHHLYESEIFCQEDLSMDPPCHCRYLGINSWEGSPILLRLQELGNTVLHCEDMVGRRDAELGALSIRESKVQGPWSNGAEIIDRSPPRKFQEGGSCELLWPRSGSILRVGSSRQLHQLRLSCTGYKAFSCRSGPMSPPATLTISCVYRSGFVGSQTMIEEAMFKQTGWPVLDLDIVCLNKSDFALVGSFDLRVCGGWDPRGDAIQALDIGFRLSFSFDETLELSFTSHPLVVANWLLPVGMMSFQTNPLLSAAPLALPSQLDLPHFLNNRQLWGTGLAVCCGTDGGLEVIMSLIGQWGVRETDGDGRYVTLVVQVLHCPPSYAAGGDEGLERLQGLLHQSCRTRDRASLNCVLLSEKSPISSLSPQSLSFAFIDVFRGYEEYTRALGSLFPLLSPDGLLVGSRYASHLGLPDPLLISHSVDGFAAIGLTIPHTVLATHAESERDLCKELMKHDVISHERFVHECSPAWFILKQGAR